ncbi:MAG: arsC [Caulobacter sp.]|nr:arsC [Caulobacter sp.]
MSDPTVTIFHNPSCGASRNTLEILRERGIEPTVVEYLKAGWTKPQLQGLLKTMNARPADILRTKGERAAELGLIGADDDTILDAMVAEPGLVERPIVLTPRGAALCRPRERVLGLL